MAATSEFLAKPTWNPVEVAADPRVAMTAVGTLVAYAKRKAAYKAFRGVFGVAVHDNGRIVYYAANSDGTVDKSREVPGAFLNRILFNLSDVIAGSLIIGRVRDPNGDYLGLGLATGGMANLIMTLLNVE